MESLDKDPVFSRKIGYGLDWGFRSVSAALAASSGLPLPGSTRRARASPTRSGKAGGVDPAVVQSEGEGWQGGEPRALGRG